MSFDLPLRQIISGLDSRPGVPSLSGVSITENTRVNPTISNQNGYCEKGLSCDVKKCETGKIRNVGKTLTAGERTVSDKDSPSRSVTRLLDRKVLTGVTWGEGAGSTGEDRQFFESNLSVTAVICL